MDCARCRRLLRAHCARPELQRAQPTASVLDYVPHGCLSLGVVQLIARELVRAIDYIKGPNAR